MKEKFISGNKNKNINKVILHGKIICKNFYLYAILKFSHVTATLLYGLLEIRGLFIVLNKNISIYEVPNEAAT